MSGSVWDTVRMFDVGTRLLDDNCDPGHNFCRIMSPRVQGTRQVQSQHIF